MSFGKFQMMVTSKSIPGATNQSFTPRQEHVGKTLRVVLLISMGKVT